MTGAGEMLKLARPDLQVVATEPEAAALMSGKEWTPHKIQGWTPDFLPKIMKVDIADRIITVTDEESRDTARDLATKEGIFTGVSGGGTVAAALKAADEAPKGSTLLAMIPDTAERYLSTFLFDGITEDSDADWLVEQGYDVESD
jgi:cysteine synthase A